MRKILALALLLVIAQFTYGQNGAFGPRVSLISTNLSIADNVSNIQEGSAEFGYQFGGFIRLSLGKTFMLMPEVLFTDTNATVSLNNTNADLDFNRIDVPVLLGMKFLFLRLQAGPSFSFLTSAESDIGGTIEDISQDYKSTTVGYQIGVGMDLLNLLAIDLKYDGSLSDINEDGIGGIQADQRPRTLVLSVGLKLISGKKNKNKNKDDN